MYTLFIASSFFLCDASYAATSAQQVFDDAVESFAYGRYGQSIEKFSEILLQESKDVPRDTRIKSLIGRSQSLQALGKYRLAIEDLKEAQGLVSTEDSPRLSATISGSLGTAYWFSGNLTQASRLLDQCLLYAEEAGDRPLLVVTYSNKANVLADRGNPVAANRLYDKALSTAAATNDLSSSVTIHLQKTSTLLNAGLTDEARDALSHVLDLIPRLQQRREKAYALIWAAKLTAAIQRNGNTAQGVDVAQLLRSALEQATSIDDKFLQAEALNELAHLRNAAADYDGALSLARRGLFLSQSIGAPEVSFQLHWKIGRILAERGDDIAAIQSYTLALTTLESVRRDVSALYRAGRASFRDAVGDLYLETAGLYLKQLGSDKNATEAERREYILSARRVAERLKQADLQDYFGDECVAQLKRRIVSIEDALTDEAIVYPIVLKDRVELILSVKGNHYRIPVAVARIELHERVREFYRLLAVWPLRDYEESANQLYDWLIRPLHPWFRQHNIKALIFVPDGILRTIPISALRDGEKFLIEKYSVSVSPSITLTDPKPFPKAKINVLAAGIWESTAGFSELEFARKELQALKGLYPGVYLLDDGFSVTDLENALGREPFSVLHIASHAKFEDNISSSYLLTKDGKLSFDELEMLVHFSRFRRQPIELLTLSACQTAAGDDRSALGLAGIGIKAGARSVLGSLWLVNDETTSDLILTFYEEYRNPAATKAEALRTAQLKFIASRTLRSHPYFWAPFTLVGNWL